MRYERPDPVLPAEAWLQEVLTAYKSYLNWLAYSIWKCLALLVGLLKRRYVLPALLFPPVVLTLGLLFIPHSYGNRVTRENIERIKAGMTEAECRAILGKPWDDSLFDPEGPKHPENIYLYICY
jgi:hypothetical protein